MPFEYTCSQCNRPFTKPSRLKSEKAFCSRACYHAFTKAGSELPCPVCGKPTYFTRSQIEEGRRYCSRECYEADRSPDMVTKICPVCGREFEVSERVAHRYTVCSWECRDRRSEHTCERCGKTFLSNEQRWTPRFCSEECRRPPIIETCRNCGSEFRREPADFDRQFCCFACYRAFSGETLPERAVRFALDAIGVTYIQECQVGRYSIDFALPALKIALEVDGEYWHQDTSKESRRTRYLERHGWRVARITDTEIANAEHLATYIASRLNTVAASELPRLQPPLF